MPNPPIVVFNGRLLPPSETFILAQANGLRQFTPYFVGARRVEGLPLPADRTLVVNQNGRFGHLQEALFKVAGVAPALYRRLRHLNPGLVHAHFGVCGALALPLAQAIRRPLLVTFHGLDATMSDEYARRESLTTRLYLQRRQRLKREARLFIAVSEFIKTRLLNQGFPAEKLVVHYIGVDVQTFQPDPAILREPIVLFVGRLTEKKGCDFLIRAMAQVQQSAPDAELVILGDGGLRSELEATAKTVLKRYRFLGMQPAPVVKQWMNRATALVAPSVTSTTGDSEGLGMVLLEAQAMGLPVIASLHGGMPEAIVPGETGFLHPERDWQAIAQSILRLLQEQDLWQKFSLEGQKRVQTTFNLSRQNELLEAIYQMHFSAEALL